MRGRSRVSEGGVRVRVRRKMSRLRRLGTWYSEADLHRLVKIFSSFYVNHG